MPGCFTVIGSITSTIRKFVNGVRAQAIGHFIFELEKLEICVYDLKIVLILQKGRFLLLPFFKRALKSSDTLIIW